MALRVCAWAVAVSLPVAAQTPIARIRPEYRVPSRRLVSGPVDRTRTVAVPGAVSSRVSASVDLGPRDPSAAMEHMQLLLVRPAERQAAFDAEVEALHLHGSPSYHQWLTPETVGSEFGPDPADVAALTSYLQQEGFQVNTVGRSGLYVDFSGTVAQVQQSFHTEIHDLRLPTGEQRYGAVTEAQIPEALASLVAGFVSLSNISGIHPSYRKAVPPAPRFGLGPVPAFTVSSTNYAVGPQDFYTIYNETPLLNAATPINGSGVTIALLEESAINTADVTYFRNYFGVSPATPASLVVDTGYGSNTCTAPAELESNGEEGEAVLDTEWAGTVAPAANLIFMQCATTSSTGGIFLSAEAVIDNNLADIMSLSYDDFEGDSSSEATLVNNLWEQAASQGQTVVVSAGDTGPATEDGDLQHTYARHGITVSALSSTAWNVSAGGTDFQDTYNGLENDSAFGIGTFWNSSNGPGEQSALGYVPEMPWNDTCASSIYNAYVEGATADPAALCGATSKADLYMVAGGGGPSTLHARPSWQNATVYGLPPQLGTYTNSTNRLQPDVSLFAANGFWYHSLPSYESDSSSSISYAGGTSFVAPQLAGVFALIKQQTGERLGQPNYVLYSIAGAEYGTTSYTATSCNGSGAAGINTTSSLPASSCIFYDIQTGNNSVDCSARTTDCYVLSGKSYGILSTSSTAEDPAFSSNAGWDPATGLGSVNIANLVNKWQNAAAGGTLYTPTVAVTPTLASSTYGEPSATTYTATVSGSGSYPTGSVTFSGSGSISTIGNDALAGSSGCSSGSTCTESAAQAYAPATALAAGSYTITATYLSTNENYLTGSGTTTLTVNKQTPSISVSAVTVAIGAASANLQAMVTYVGTGVLAPSGGLTFQVDAGSVVTASCSGTSSPLTCTYVGYPTSTLASGAHTITAKTIADTNYASSTGTGTLNVLPAPTIAFSVPTHHTMDQPFAVAATSNSSGAFSYSVVSGPATIAGNTVTLSGAAGTVMLLATEAASSSYAGGTQTASFTVTAGSIWFGNNTGSLSTFDLTGSAISSSGYTGGGVATIAPALGMAFDSSGNMWVASSAGVSEFTRQGIAVSSTPFTVGGISNPLAIAVDGLGQVWVANAGGTVSVLSNSGAAVSPSTGYSGPGSKPAGIAIDIAGSVWVPSNTANTVTRILGVAAPVVPLATGAAGSPGVEP